jgi:hypothetical protein
VKSPNRPFTVRMMSRLISIAVTDVAPNVSAESTSRPPPTPMTATRGPGRT